MENPKQLKEYLEEKHISQIAFAKDIGVSPSMISRYVNRRSKPSVDVMIAISEMTNSEVGLTSWR